MKAASVLTSILSALMYSFLWCVAAQAQPCTSPGQCNDGNVCTIDDCIANQCQHSPRPLGFACDDGSVCTAGDFCDGAGSCLFGTPIQCDNGQFCDGVETCHPTAGCQPGAPVNCSDPVACTIDSCDEINDVCMHVPNHSLCDDGLICTGTETCNVLTGCQSGIPLNCDDGDFCNGVETCHPVSGCQPGTPVDCADNVGCTVDTCDEGTDQCVHTPNDNACYDGEPCTLDVCDVVNDCGHVLAVCAAANDCEASGIFGAECIDGFCDCRNMVSTVLQPVGATGPHTIVGREILLPAGGQRVTIDLLVDKWLPETLKLVQVGIDPTGYTSGTSGSVAPATAPCTTDADCIALFGPGAGNTCHDTNGDTSPDTCIGALINTQRADFVFAGAAGVVFATVDTSDPFVSGLQYASSVLSGTDCAEDNSTPAYIGTLLVDVSANASGQFSIKYDGLDRLIDWCAGKNVDPVRELGVTISVAVGACCIGSTGCVTATAAECTSQGGAFAGLQTSCSSSPDCDANGLTDVCDRLIEIAHDCNGNGILDECELVSGSIMDCDSNGIPDECDTDCDGNGNPDACDVRDQLAPDCNFNDVPDSCDIVGGYSADLNGNQKPDECDRRGTCGDIDSDGIVSLTDYMQLLTAMTGPGEEGLALPDLADVDRDGDVDLADAATAAAQLGEKPGFPPDCVPGGPVLQAFRRCYEVGESAKILVHTPAYSSGSVRLSLHPESGADVDLNNPISESIAPCNGSQTYVFNMQMPFVEGSYVAIAEIRDAMGTTKALDSFDLGVRPSIPGVSEELCTYELIEIDVAQLRSGIEAAVLGGDPITLQFGSHTFDVMLGNATNDYIAPAVLAQYPGAALYQGSIVGDPASSVAVTFHSAYVTAAIEPGADEADSVHVTPMQVLTASAPSSNSYAVYESSHVGLPPEPEDETGGEPIPTGVDTPVSALTNCPNAEVVLHVFVDLDPLQTVMPVFAEMAAAFNRRLGIRLRMNQPVTFISTSAYRDPPSLLIDFSNNRLGQVIAGGSDIGILFTNNPNGPQHPFGLSYHRFPGQSFFNAFNLNRPPMCWVHNRDTTLKIVAAALHEVSHVLGACQTPSTHRCRAVHKHCHARFLGICLLPKHRHRSCMWSGNSCERHWSDSVFGVRRDARWVLDDRRTIRNTLKTHPARFCP